MRHGKWFSISVAIIVLYAIYIVIFIPGSAAIWKNNARKNGHVNWSDVFGLLERVSIIAITVAMIGFLLSMFIGITGVVITVLCLLIYAIAFFDFWSNVKKYNRFLSSSSKLETAP